MDSKIFSRSYLQSISHENQKREIERMVEEIAPNLIRAANEGHTSYLYDMTNMRFIPPVPYNQRHMVQSTFACGSSNYTIPLEEILPLLKEKFPGCDISYKEEHNDESKSLKKGILINWS